MSSSLELILASGNAHKAQEFAELFDPSVLKISAAPEKIEVIEDGDSFQANALLKAQAYYNRFKRPVLADDSGLVVTALPNELGIHSARFGGEGLTDKERYQLLLKRLEAVDEREACFVCQLCFYLSPNEIYFFEGRLRGTIAREPSGENGFGYVPIFVPDKEVKGTSLV